MDTLEELLCAGTSGGHNNNNGGSGRDWATLNVHHHHHHLMNSLSKTDSHKTIYDIIKTDPNKVGGGGGCMYNFQGNKAENNSKTQGVYETLKSESQKSSYLFEVIKNECENKVSTYEGQTVLSSSASNLITTTLSKDRGKGANGANSTNGGADGSADSTTPPPPGVQIVADKRNPINSIRGISF